MTRLDLTDPFVFTAPYDLGTTVLIIDSNRIGAPPQVPAPVTGPEFYPGAVYRINIDTDGDALADVAFTFAFSDYIEGRQTGTVRYATGAPARQPEPAGEVLTTGIPVSFGTATLPMRAGQALLCAVLTDTAAP